MNSERFNHLVEAWRDDRLTTDEAAELSALLRADEDARRTFRSEAELHGLLHCAANAVAVAQASSLARGAMGAPVRLDGFVGWLKRHLVIALACGVGVGIASASVWTIAQRPVMQAEVREIPLGLPVLETRSGRIASGFPAEIGVWSGDEAEFVARADLPTTADAPVLRFLKPEIHQRLRRPAYSCDVFQLVDLRALRAQLKAGQEATLELSADFLDARSGPRPDIRLAGAILLFAGDPATLRANWPAALDEMIGAGRDHIDTAGKPAGQWHRVTARSLVDESADLALIRLSVVRRDAEPIELGHQFVANLKLVLKTQPQLSVRIAHGP